MEPRPRHTKLSVVLLVALLSWGVNVCNSPGNPPPAPEGYTWKEVKELSDSFASPTIDTTKWMTTHPYWKGRAPSVFNPNNIVPIENKGGNKEGNKEGNKGGDNESTNPNPNLLLFTDQPMGQPIQTACLSSKEPLFSPNMYSEATFAASKMSATSSFWFQGGMDTTLGTEIDVAEQIGAPAKFPELAQKVMANTHTFTRKNPKETWENDQYTRIRGKMKTPSTDPHTYGVWWQSPTAITFFIDNTPLKTAHPPVPFTTPMYLFLDTEIFSWFGFPSPTELTPKSKQSNNAMKVYNVKTWVLIKKP
jgi:hypothetical protein